MLARIWVEHVPERLSGASRGYSVRVTTAENLPRSRRELATGHQESRDGIFGTFRDAPEILAFKNVVVCPGASTKGVKNL
jgi:hypothetical protein